MATATMPETELVNLNAQKQDALEFAKNFPNIEVVDRVTHEQACDALLRVAAKRRWWQLIVAPAKEAAHKAHRAICTMESTVDAPLANLELRLKAGIKEYERREEQARRAEEERIREELRKAQEAQALKDAEEATLNAAIEAEEKGDVKTAEAILDAPIPQVPVYVPPVIVPSTVTKQAGISSRENWKARVINPDLVPREFLMVDTQRLNAYAKAMKAQARVPGVEFYDDKSIAVRV